MSATRRNNQQVCIYLSIYLVFAFIALIAVTVYLLVVFVCFAPQQFIISINNVNTSANKSIAMTPSLKAQPEHHSNNYNWNVIQQWQWQS